MSRRDQLRNTLATVKSFVVGGQRRQTAVAMLLKPDNLFQPHATTEVNRYPDEFAAIARSVTTMTPSILSFGCSSGEELFSLNRVFPQARIRGIDVNPLAVRTARKRAKAAGLDGLITVERAGDASAEAPGSYDVVLALAVFRHAELNDAPPNCAGVLAFADFERTVTGLSGCVRPGGLLVLRHANFRFTDCAVAAEYEAVSTGYESAGEGGLPTPLYGRDDKLVGVDGRDDGIYRKR